MFIDFYGRHRLYVASMSCGSLCGIGRAQTSDTLTKHVDDRWRAQRHYRPQRLAHSRGHVVCKSLCGAS